MIKKHADQPYMAVEDIDHMRTRANSPQTYGICERFHQLVPDEFYRIAFRKKIFNTLGELQIDLDEWISYYNEECTHPGKSCYGKTPMTTFADSTHIAKVKGISLIGKNSL